MRSSGLNVGGTHGPLSELFRRHRVAPALGKPFVFQKSMHIFVSCDEPDTSLVWQSSLRNGLFGAKPGIEGNGSALNSAS